MMVESNGKSSSNQSEEDGTAKYDPSQGADDGRSLARVLTSQSIGSDGRRERSLDPEVSSRIESLARTLSQHRMRDGDIEFGDVDMEAIFTSIIGEFQKQNVSPRKAGVVMQSVDVSVIDTSALEERDYTDMLLIPRTILRKRAEVKYRTNRKILNEVDLLARPGEMVLVLGRPGAGCSTFLKVVAGETKGYQSVSGSITYDGIDQTEMMKNYKSEVIYNGEVDVHFPHLTVQQTLDFALACKTPHTRPNGMSRQQYVTMMRELYATTFGLTRTYGTKVGNDYIRGVSGGERKRVSIAEALAASGSVYCWDNATRGLDASTALEYAEAIRLMTNLLKSTTLVTIYQASERIYDTFDKVTVLFEGRQVYFGPIPEAKAYFEDMGYMCPPRQSTAEFLTALTDINGYRVVRPGYEDRIPKTAEEFETYWRKSDAYAQLQDEIYEYMSKTDTELTKDTLEKARLNSKSKYARSKSDYMISYLKQIQLCTIRGYQRIYGDRAYTVITLVSAVVQAVISGTLYFDLPSGTSGAFSRGGILYFCTLYFSLMALASLTFDHRPILQKHKTYTLYHPSAEALASTICSATFRFVAVTLFVVIVYFLSGLTVAADRFFMVFLFVVINTEAVTAMFETIAALCDNLSQANALSGIVMLAISLYSTYMIQEPSMHPWFKWISYILPIRYAFENMLNAEFHNRHLDCNESFVPSGPGYESYPIENKVCAFIGSKPSQSWVLGDDYLRVQYDYTYSHQWRNLGILIIFALGYIILKAVATEYKAPVKSKGESLIFKKGTLARRRQLKSTNDIEAKSSSIDCEAYRIASHNTAHDPSIFAGLKNEDVFLWKNVSYSVPYKGETRQLLDNVSGYCIPGTLTALMGESGAGKTTLLNTLANRNVGIITGDMLVNGVPIDSSFGRRTGYVQQQDIHTKELTVRESLIFSARLRRPQSVPEEEKLSYVEKVISVLGMDDYADAIVGEAGYGLNVEQRKKLSIGVELVAKPSLLLFLDEPTSGLDSQSAWAIVQLLKKLAEAGQAILCTIHQPSATLFEQFDRLLLLKRGGQTVYFGDVGEHSSTIVQYFESNGARKCKPEENPAEYILEVIGAGATAVVEEDWAQIWNVSKEKSDTDVEIDRLIKELQDVKRPLDPESYRTFATSYSYQFYYVLRRTFTVFYRDVDYLMAKQSLLIVGGLFIGFTFYDVGESYTGMQNAMFAVFMSIVLSAPNMNQIQSKAVASKDLYLVRESKSNTYHWSFLLFSQYLVELPFQFIYSTLFFVCMYFPLKTPTDSFRAGVFYLDYCILFQLYFVGLALAFFYVSPNLESGNVLLGLALSFLISFCGVVQPYRLMPNFWKFMYRTSPYTYFVQNLMALMMHDKKVVCSAKEYSYLNPPSGMTCGEYMDAFTKFSSGYVANPDATEACQYCIYRVGDEYLTTIAIKFSELWRNFGLYWIYIGFNIIAMCVLFWLFNVKSFSLKFKK